MDPLKGLASSAPRWIHVALLRETQAEPNRETLESRTGVVTLVLEGKHMRNYDGLFTEFASKLRFPAYFGRNFNALEDSLTDLPWLDSLDSRGCLLWIRDGAMVLELEERDARIAFVKILDRACAEWNRDVREGQPWDRPAIPFHVVFCDAEAARERLLDLLKESGVSYSDLHVNVT